MVMRTGGGEYWKTSLVVVLTRGGGGSMGSRPLPGNIVDRAVMLGNRIARLMCPADGYLARTPR